ncbi:MAG: hypothetical protein IJD13_04905 [Oscillospiraceae bacterium]|nr:hypothetical protein [Oscillospiraceae bacterium]
MRKIMAFLSALIIMMTFAGCGETVKEPETTTFASYNGSYEITAPNDWKRYDESAAYGTTILLESGNGAAAFMIYEEARADYNFTFEEYYDALVQMIAYDNNQIEDSEVTISELEKLLLSDGTEVWGCEFPYCEDGITNMIMQLYLFETDDNYVRVVVSALKSKFEGYRATLTDMVESTVCK